MKRLESGLDEVKVPRDKSCISKILPELKTLKEKNRPDNLRPHLLHHKPEITEQDFTEVAGGVINLE